MFDLQITCSDWSGSFNGVNDGTFNLTLWYIVVSGPASPWARFRDMLGVGNYGRFSNPNIPGLLAQAGKAVDPLAVKTIYNQLDRIFMDNAVGIPLMYRPSEFYAFNTAFLGGFPTSEDASAPPMFSGAGVEIFYKISSGENEQ